MVSKAWWDAVGWEVRVMGVNGWACVIRRRGGDAPRITQKKCFYVLSATLQPVPKIQAQQPIRQ